MKLPDSVPIDDEVLAAIADRHGLRWDRAEPVISAGIINSIYALGDAYVLRVPRNHRAHIAQAEREASVIPAAVGSGVRTAGLVAFDDSRELLPVPYLVVERLSGASAESLPPESVDTTGMWQQVGRDLARLHTIGDAAPNLERADEFVFPDPRGLVDERATDGWISAIEARWLTGWLDRLAGAGSKTAVSCLIHGDVQLSNVLVAERRYQALIDWGCARTDDPAADFVAMPLAAVPHLLSGHRAIAPLPDDDNAEARILWRRLQMLLAVLPRGAAPGTTWGERPVAWLVDLLRFFVDTPVPDAWRPLAPPASATIE